MAISPSEGIISSKDGLLSDVSVVVVSSVVVSAVVVVVASVVVAIVVSDTEAVLRPQLPEQALKLRITAPAMIVLIIFFMTGSPIVCITRKPLLQTYSNILPGKPPFIPGLDIRQQSLAPLEKNAK